MCLDVKIRVADVRSSMESKRKEECPKLSKVYRSLQGVSCKMEEEICREGRGFKYSSVPQLVNTPCG